MEALTKSLYLKTILIVSYSSHKVSILEIILGYNFMCFSNS